MRKIRPLRRGRGTDGVAKEEDRKSLNTNFQVTKLEWVEEEPSLHPNVGARLGLQFVTETGVARPHGSFRDLIRSKARRKGPNVNEILQPPRKNSKFQSTSNVDSGSERSGTTTPSPSGLRTPNTPRFAFIYGLEDTLIDPFYTLPISEHGATQFLIHHYFTIFKPSYAPILKKEDLFNFAITDSASLHSTLVHSALNLQRQRKISPDADLLYHQGESIRLINDRLGDSCNGVATDATIFTVCNMTHLEILSAAPSGIRIHMDGLEALVQNRGGIQGLNFHPLTRKVVLWTDTVAAIALETTPRFQFHSCTTCEPISDPGPYSPIALRYQTKLSNLTGCHPLTEEMISTYEDLRALTTLKDTICFSSPSSPSPTTASLDTCAHIIEHLERRCLSIIQHPFLFPFSPDLAVFLLFANASLIHLTIFMRESPRRQPFASLLSTCIRTTLQCLDLHTFQTRYPELILWILVMSGFGAVDTENQNWFAGVLAQAAGVAGLKDREEVCGVVGMWLWSALYGDGYWEGEGFWADFGAWMDGDVDAEGEMQMEMEGDEKGSEFVEC